MIYSVPSGKPTKQYLFTLSWLMIISCVELFLMSGGFLMPYQLAAVFLIMALPLFIQFSSSLPVFMLYLLLGSSILLNTLVDVPGMFTNITFAMLLVLLLFFVTMVFKGASILDAFNNNVSGFFLLFLFFSVLSILINPAHFTFKDNLFAVLIYVSCFLSYFCSFCLFIDQTIEGRGHSSIFAFSEAIFLSVFLSLYVVFLFINSGMPAMKGSDVITIFGGGGPMGCFFLLFFSILFGIYMNLNKPQYKMLFIVLMATLLLGLFFTFSRAAILGAAASVLMISYFKGKRTFFIILTGSIGAFILFPLLQGLILDLYTARRISYTFNRIDIWSDAFSIFNKNLFFGIGAGNYSYFSNFSLRGFIVQSPHNNYLQIMAESGIFGFMSFAALVLSILKTSLDSYKGIGDPILKGASLGFLGATIGILVASFFGDFLLPAKENLGYLSFAFVLYFWIILGFIAALNRNRNRSYAK